MMVASLQRDNKNCQLLFDMSDHVGYYVHFAKPIKLASGNQQQQIMSINNCRLRSFGEANHIGNGKLTALYYSDRKMLSAFIW